MSDELGGGRPTDAQDEFRTALTQVIASALASGEAVTIDGLGQFSLRSFAAYAGRDPRSGQEVSVPAKRLAFFKAARALRDGLQRGTDLDALTFSAPALGARLSQICRASETEIAQRLQRELNTLASALQRSSLPTVWGRLGVFRYEQKPGAAGELPAGAAIRVEERRVLTFRPAAALRAALSGVRPPALVSDGEVRRILASYPGMAPLSQDRAAAALDRLEVPRQRVQRDEVAQIERAIGCPLPALLRGLLQSHDLRGLELLSARLLCDPASYRELQTPYYPDDVAFAVSDEGCWFFERMSAGGDPVVFFSSGKREPTDGEPARFTSWLTAALLAAELRQLCGTGLLLSEQAATAVLKQIAPRSAVASALVASLPY